MEIFGFISNDTLSLLEKLAFTEDEKSFIKVYSKSIRTAKWIALLLFITYTLESIAFITIISTVQWITLATQSQKIFILTVFLVINILFAFTKSAWSHYQNYTNRLTKYLLDNILELIVYNYRLSLGDSLPNFRNTKKISNDLAGGIFSYFPFISNVQYFIMVLSGCVINGTILLFSFSNQTLLVLSVSFIALIAMTIIYVRSLRYEKFALNIEDVSDEIDQYVKNAKSLSLQPDLNFTQSDIINKVKQITSTTDKININYTMFQTVLPILNIFLPIFIEYIPKDIFLTIYIIGLFSNAGGIVQNLSGMRISNNREKELNDFLHKVSDCESEMSPTKYLKLRLKSKTKKEFTKAQNNSFRLSNVKYLVGRSTQNKTVFVDKMELPAQKISFLFGASGIGKSILGRLITLRFSSFTADFIGIKDFDIRNFKTLYEGRDLLLYSGIREINTSYRASVSMYLRKKFFQKSFAKLIIDGFNSKTIRKKAYKHIMQHSYYKHLQKMLYENTEQVSTKSLSQSAWEDLANMYMNLFDSSKLNTAYQKILEANNSRYSQRILSLLVIAEYITFSHLKKYIPEASLFFMDAILSEPPISQGQRRRVIYALDIFIKALLFVIDEPSSNLDKETFTTIFEDISSYANLNKSCVLVIEPRLNQEMVDLLRKKNCLGNIYEITNDSSNYIVKKI
jgi:ABC-type ATPase involved in cell division